MHLVRRCYSTIAGCILRPSEGSPPLVIVGASRPQLTDLTHKVKTLGPDAIAQSGFSDIYYGELEEDVVGENGMKRKVKRKASSRSANSVRFRIT